MREGRRKKQCEKEAQGEKLPPFFPSAPTWLDELPLCRRG